MVKPPLVVIAGPTASGKSALALAIAVQHNGVVINADASQLYGELPILTAQPGRKEQEEAPHQLYGVLEGRDYCSVGRWVEMARKAIAAAHAEGRLPVLVGGTGLYLASLLEGIADIPPVPLAVRAAVRSLTSLEVRGALEAEDATLAARLHPNDRQRNSRALEVVRGTGHSLSYWQRRMMPGIAGEVALDVRLLLPEKEVLYARCETRFQKMLAAGAMEEVRALLQQGLPPDLPVMKALGVPPLAAVIRGELTLGEATERVVLQTRQYAKRQRTWFHSGGQARRGWLAGAKVCGETF